MRERFRLAGSPVERAVLFVAWAILPGLFGCTSPGTESGEFQPFAEAVVLYAQSDTAGLRPYRPVDLKPESRWAVWVVDGLAKVAGRIEPREADYRILSVASDSGPLLDSPMRLAVSNRYGLFVYDHGTRKIRQFNLDGSPIRDIDPPFPPSRLEITEAPIGLVYSGITMVDDSLAHLKVVRTDLLGSEPDTLLFPGTRGPEALQKAPMNAGPVSMDASHGGIWVLARAVPDTVFELRTGGPGRRVVLRPEDQPAAGILTDLERDVLWLVRQDPEVEGAFLYSAYDIGSPGVLSAAERFLGVRRTPPGFEPRAATDGLVIGFEPSDSQWRVVAMDMKLPRTR